MRSSQRRSRLIVNKPTKSAEEIAEEHWKYTEMIILNMLKLTEDLYKAAMIHGLKHREESKEAD